MTDTIGVAVIGAGMAGRSHANGYRMAGSVSDDRLPTIRLVAIADANEAFAQETARRYGFERHASGWQEIAADPGIDAVSIVVPNPFHREVAVGLLAAGKHVLCDKPLANTLADAQAMAEAAARSGRVAAVGYSYRRSPSINAIRDEVESGAFGTLRQLDLHYWCDYAADADAPMTWRYRGGPGTGAISDLGSHLVDLAEFLVGPIASVSTGVLATFIDRRPIPLSATRGHGHAEVGSELAVVETEDIASFSAMFENGAVGTFSVSRVAFGHPNSLGFSVFGDSAAASFDQARPAEFRFADATVPEMTRGFRQVLAGPLHPYLEQGLPMTHSGVGYGYSELFAFQARAFLDEVAGLDGLPRCPSFADGLHVMRLTEAVVQSAQAGGAAVAIG
jgi:predicted dehydrogenase